MCLTRSAKIISRNKRRCRPGDKARDKLNDIGEAILAEKMPKLAIKYGRSFAAPHALIQHLQRHAFARTS